MSTYLESDALLAAKKETAEHLEKRPVYTSRWDSALSETMDALADRQFSYDPATDPVYQSYRRAYTRKGRLAMEDTLGKTTALTGGYGNSYAAAAAQQSYNGYMQALTDKIPELYDLARELYDKETAQLNARYEQYLQREQQDQAAFEDSFDAWLKELQILQDKELAMSKEDYDRFEDQRDWDDKHPANSGSSGSSGSSGDYKPVYDNGSVSEANIKKMQAALGVAVDGKWGPESYAAAGNVDADTAWLNYLSEYGPPGGNT